MVTHVDCPKCDGALIEYSREYIGDGDDQLCCYQHTAEQQTTCDGCMQVRASGFGSFGVEAGTTGEGK